MLYQYKRSLSDLLDPERITYGEGRSETGLCLHLPLKRSEEQGQIAGAAHTEDHALMITVANNLIEYLKYKRPIKGPEDWDYDGDKAGEIYTVCGDNPTTSGLVIFDKNYEGGAKLQIILDKTFGANEIAIKWKFGMVLDETLLKDYKEYLINAIKTGELREEKIEEEVKPKQSYHF